MYRFLGAAERIGCWDRPGGHDHGPADWRAFLDLAAWRFRGTPPEHAFLENPFPDLPPVHHWSAPGRAADAG